MNPTVPENDKNKVPEKKAPKLPESIMMPEIKKTRKEVSTESGEVIFSADKKEVGRTQTIKEALAKYDDGTANVINEFSEKNPGWFQKALQSSRQSWAASGLATDRINQQREEQQVIFENKNAPERLEWEQHQYEQAVKKANRSAQEARELENKVSGPVRAVFTSIMGGIGEGLSALAAGARYRWKERKDEYHARKNSTN
jgi:hypothetical protein